MGGKILRLRVPRDESMPIAPWDQPDVEMVPSRTTVAHAQSEELNFLGVPRGTIGMLCPPWSVPRKCKILIHWECRTMCRITGAVVPSNLTHLPSKVKLFVHTTSALDSDLQTPPL